MLDTADAAVQNLDAQLEIARHALQDTELTALRLSIRLTLCRRLYEAETVRAVYQHQRTA